MAVGLRYINVHVPIRDLFLQQSNCDIGHGSVLRVFLRPLDTSTVLRQTRGTSSSAFLLFAYQPGSFSSCLFASSIFLLKNLKERQESKHLIPDLKQSKATQPESTQSENDDLSSDNRRDKGTQETPHDKRTIRPNPSQDPPKP